MARHVNKGFLTEGVIAMLAKVHALFNSSAFDDVRLISVEFNTSENPCEYKVLALRKRDARLIDFTVECYGEARVVESREISREVV